jgi:hypothetical protein
VSEQIKHGIAQRIVLAARFADECVATFARHVERGVEEPVGLRPAVPDAIGGPVAGRHALSHSSSEPVLRHRGRPA